MPEIAKIEDIQKLIIELRGQRVLVDADVAEIYDVETKEINRAVSNNPDKFPAGYVFKTTNGEFDELRRKFSTAKFAKTRVNPKAFTEKGLYMLATILKSAHATQTTLMIIETFAKIRELTRTINTLSGVKNEKEKQGLMQRSGELIAEVLDHDLKTTDTETSVEINFAVLKFKHTIKKKK
jgi:hypothetical protein